MPLDWDNIKDVELECCRCGYRFKGEEMLFIEKLACPECGYKVLRKIRPPIVKRVKAI